MAIKFANRIEYLYNELESVCSLADGGFSFRFKTKIEFEFVDIEINNGSYTLLWNEIKRGNFKNIGEYELDEILEKLKNNFGFNKK